MYKNVLQSIVGVEVYAIISMLLFLSIFVGMIILVLRMRKSTIDHVSRLPLEDDDTLEDVLKKKV
jgi:cbb3-type cytochrome oxidase subunit 3